MAESSNKSHFMDLTVRRLYYSSIRLDYFFILLEVYDCKQLLKLHIQHNSRFILYTISEVPLSVCKFTFFYHYHQMFSHKTEELCPIFPTPFPTTPLIFFPNWSGKGVRQTGKLSENAFPIVILHPELRSTGWKFQAAGG